MGRGARTKLGCGAVVAAALVSGSVVAHAASLAGASPAGADWGGAPPLLSQTGLYADLDTHAVRPDNLPFSPQYPLWTDGARKRRWIHLPAGAAVDASRPDAWEFPTGTRLWKEFSYARPVETRMLEKLADGTWRYAVYVWDADGRDATLAPVAGVRGVVEIAGGARHDVPGLTDCKGCHESRASRALGFDALQLSPDRDPLAPHADRLQDGLDLRSLAARGLVRGLPQELLDAPPRIPARTPRERAALGYLHANCGTCHASKGPLASLGLALDHDLGARVRGDEPAIRTAVGQRMNPSAPGQGDGPQARIAPGDPGRSALLARLATRNPYVQMPPVGTHLVDEDGRRLVAEWIARDLRPARPARARGAAELAQRR